MMPASNCFKKRGKKFTVIELLVVVAVMGIILGIALPSFIGLMGGGGVSAGASSVASQLRYCRSYALSKRQYVAFIIPDDYSLTKKNNNIYRCFRAARVRKPRGGSSDPYEFISWLDDSAWSFLTPGVYVEFDTNVKDVMKVDFESLQGRRQGDSLAIVFSPSGKPVKGFGSEVSAVVGEGFWDETFINNKGKELNRLRILVNSNTGRIDVLEP